MSAGKLDLWIDRKESQLGLERDQLTWRHQGQLKDRVPLKYLNSITVLGQAHLDSRLLCRLAECGVSIHLLSNARVSAGVAIGQTFVGPPRHRLLQYQCCVNPEQQLAVARVLVFGKLRNYLDTGIVQFDFPVEWRESLNALIAQIDTVRTHSQLLGVEGAASRAWFAQLKQVLPSHWGFEGRNKNPPKDPVNALLSLTYTLAAQPLRQALMARGFDLMLGFLHQPHPGRESLVCDLQEWLRPLLDAWIIQTVCPAFRPEDFTVDPQYGCRLHKEERARFYQLWYERYDQWPGLSEFQKETVSLPELSDQLVRLHQALFQQISEQADFDWKQRLEQLGSSVMARDEDDDTAEAAAG